MEEKSRGLRDRFFKTLNFLLILFIVFIGVGMSTSPVLAETVTVDDDGGSNVDFTQIQSAINNVNDGDTIIVNSGDYKENLTITKNITITTSGSDAFLNGTNMTGRTLTAINIGKNAEPTIIGLDIRDFIIGVNGKNTEGSWTLRDLNISGNNLAVNTTRAKGSWSLENVIIAGNFAGINANKTTGKWRIKDTYIAGGFLAILAAESTNDWTIENSVVDRTLGASLVLSGSTGDWEIRDTEINLTFFGIAATGTTGDWSLQNTTVKNIQGGGILVTKSSGDWSINDSVIENINFASSDATVSPDAANGTAILANETEGNWSIHYTVIRNIAGEKINGTNSLFEGNATLNWWGSSDGPSSGDCVGNVDCTNWLTSLPSGVEQSILKKYNTNGKAGIQRSEVKRAIQCYLFSQNCIGEKLNSSQVQKIIKAYLFA